MTDPLPPEAPPPTPRISSPGPALRRALQATVATVLALVAALILGSVFALVLAQAQLPGDATKEQVRAWLDAHPFLTTTAGWALAIPALLLVARRVGLTRAELGLQPRGRPPRHLITGSMVGLGLLLLPALLARALGGYEPVPASPGVLLGAAALPTIAFLLPALVVAAFGEELLVRGVLLRLWTPSMGARGAVLFTSSLFVLMHLGNPGATLQGAVGVLIAGIALGLLVSQTGSLFLATGAHLGWNVAESMVLGLPVSGQSLPSLLRWSPADAPWAQGLLGGAFGPEEGLLFHGALSLAVGGLLLREALARRAGPSPTA